MFRVSGSGVWGFVFPGLMWRSDRSPLIGDIPLPLKKAYIDPSSQNLEPGTQRTQYPLTKECTLNYRGLNVMI